MKRVPSEEKDAIGDDLRDKNSNNIESWSIATIGIPFPGSSSRLTAMLYNRHTLGMLLLATLRLDILSLGLLGALSNDRVARFGD